jgi:hypothetical protein
MMFLPVFAPVLFEADTLSWQAALYSVDQASSLKNAGKIQDSWLYDCKENNALEHVERR